jgi:AraC family transcriptional regulator
MGQTVSENLEATRSFDAAQAAPFAGEMSSWGSHPSRRDAPIADVSPRKPSEDGGATERRTWSPTLESSGELTVPPLGGDVATSVVRMLESVQQNFDHREAALASLAHAASLLRIEIDRRSAPRPASPRGALVAWQMKRVMAYIDENLDGPILTRDLAAITRRSSDYFGRAFKCTTGETPHDFIVARRLRRARELMLESAASLAEIAISCGFFDQAHFSRVFRLGHGQSPAVWRRERREIVEHEWPVQAEPRVVACA